MKPNNLFIPATLEKIERRGKAKEKFLIPVPDPLTLQDKIKKIMRVYTREEIATIVKHRGNMLELDQTSHGEEKEAIQLEIFYCRKFIRQTYRKTYKEVKEQRERDSHK